MTVTEPHRTVARRVPDGPALVHALLDAEDLLHAMARAEHDPSENASVPREDFRHALAALYRVWDTLSSQTHPYSHTAHRDGNKTRLVRLAGTDLAVLTHAADAIRRTATTGRPPARARDLAALDKLLTVLQGPGVPVDEVSGPPPTAPGADRVRGLPA